ncbi:MAG TPA: hypothetical protein VD948_10100, partial [Rhodothermales bacterium]|nr:hypothetical protein [Rhodothermales bacterium]
MRTTGFLVLLALLSTGPAAAQQDPARADTARVALPPEEQDPGKSPLLAGALSLFLFPGAGHLYAGEFETAVLLAGTVAAGTYIAIEHGIPKTGCTAYCPPNGVFWVGLGAALGAAIYAHIDAPRAARRANGKSEGVRQALLGPALLGS